jgi:chromosome segregation ATPase
MSDERSESAGASDRTNASSAGPWLAAFLVLGLVAAYLAGAADVVTGPGILLLESALVVGAIAILVVAIPVFYLLVTHRRSASRQEQYAKSVEIIQARLRNAEAAQDAQGAKVTAQGNEIRDVRHRADGVDDDMQTFAQRQEEQHRLVAEYANRLAAAEDGFSDVHSDVRTLSESLERLERRSHKQQEALDGNRTETQNLRARLEQGSQEFGQRFETYDQRLESLEAAHEADLDWVQRMDGQRQETAAQAVEERQTTQNLAAQLREAMQLIQRMAEVQRGTDAAVGRIEETARNAINQVEAVEGIQQDHLERVMRADGTAKYALERSEEFHEFTEALERGYQELNKTVAELADRTESKVAELAEQSGRLDTAAETARRANDRWTPHERDHAAVDNRFDQTVRRLDELDERLKADTGWDEPIGSLATTVDSVRGSVAQDERRLEALEAKVRALEGRVPLTIGDIKDAEGPKGAGGRPVRDIEGIGTVYARRLRRAGVRTVEDLRDVDPEALGAEIKVSSTLVSEWTDMSNLMRVEGIGPQYSEMLVKSGYRAIADVAVADPDKVLADVQRTKKARQMPLNRAQIGLAIVSRWVQAARQQIERDDEMAGLLEAPT